MNQQEKEKIENIFRNSSDADELFDTFEIALKENLEDIESYKILFANPTLGLNEIKMFSQALCEKYPGFCFGVFTWVGNIFANKKYDSEWRKSAVDFFLKASDYEPAEPEPLIKLLELYDHEIDIPDNKLILKEVKERMNKVGKKKELYKSIAEFYKKEGNETLEKKYRSLAEKHSTD